MFSTAALKNKEEGRFQKSVDLMWDFFEDLTCSSLLEAILCKHFESESFSHLWKSRRVELCLNSEVKNINITQEELFMKNSQKKIRRPVVFLPKLSFIEKGQGANVK